MKRYLVRGTALFVSLCLLATIFAFAPHTAAHAATQAKQPVKKGNMQLLPRPLTRSANAVSPNVTAPAYTTSYYESTTSPSTLQSQGCKAAQGPAGVVVLDWGEPDASGGTYGAYDFGSAFVSDDQIFHAVANFVYGAWNCRTSSTNLAVAIGTSNDNTALAASTSTWYAAGQAWGHLILNEQNYITSNGYNTIIGAYAADDIETEWASFSLSSNFVNGYNSVTTRVFLNYGDDTPGYWTNYEVWYVSWGATADAPLPEIYYQANANEWQALNVWACNNEGGPMGFKGTMSQYPYGGNSPSTAFTEMYNAIAGNSCTARNLSYMIFSTDI